MSMHKAFLAGFVRRWHTNPHLAHTCDRIDGHAGRVARILLMMHPNPSIDLIRAALIHDDGESVSGDMPGPMKARLGQAAMTDIFTVEAKAIRDIWGRGVGDEDYHWLIFADRLDALMWAAHHAPHALTGDGWPECIDALHGMAESLGVHSQFLQLMEDLGCN